MMRHPVCRKICTLLFAVVLLVGMAGSALAAKGELKTTQQFIEYLESKDIKYTYVGVDGKSERVNVAYTLDHFNVTCAIFFRNDCEEVSLRIWDVIKASAGKNYILSTLNGLNKDYKFAKFILDESDSTVQVEMDMYIDEDHCARCVYDALKILINILDDDEVAQRLQSLE